MTAPELLVVAPLGEPTWGLALRLGAELLPIGVPPVSRAQAEAMATLWQARTTTLLERERQRAGGAATWPGEAAAWLLRPQRDGAVVFVVYDAAPRCPAFVLGQCADRAAAARQACVWQQALAAQIAATAGALRSLMACSAGPTLRLSFYR